MDVGLRMQGDYFEILNIQYIQSTMTMYTIEKELKTVQL